MRCISGVLVFLFLLISGCATTAKYNYEYEIKSTTQTFNLIDARPESEKTAEVMSYIIGNELYGVYRLGDEQIIPDRMAYLADILASHHKENLDGKNVKVSHFEIFNDMRDFLTGTALSVSLGGALGSALDASINPEGNAVIEVWISLEVDNKTFESKIARGYTISKSGGISERQLADEIRQAMDLAINTAMKE